MSYWVIVLLSTVFFPLLVGAMSAFLGKQSVEKWFLKFEKRVEGLENRLGGNSTKPHEP
jgi:hypothetical protein